MNINVLYIFGSVLIVSLVSLIGIVGVLFSEKRKGSVIIFLVSFSAGALLGDAFIHLLPEAFEKYGFGLNISLYILLGIFIFFILEKFVHWRHCHMSGECDIHEHSHRHPHSLAIMNLVGDGFHNMIDGMIIGASYLLSVPIGIATTVAVVLHEVPQELGDFAVLIHSGLSKKKAILLNFMSALLAVLGAAIALVASSYITNINAILIPVTAGGFIYIAGTDLIPELHKSNETTISLLQLLGLILGVGIMFFLLIVG
jgi:zinc and cadmium transporter